MKNYYEINELKKQKSKMAVARHIRRCAAWGYCCLLNDAGYLTKIDLKNSPDIDKIVAWFGRVQDGKMAKMDFISRAKFRRRNKKYL